jgi:hypothetical protein
MPTSDSESFKKALPAFTKQVRNELADGLDDFREKVRKAIEERWRLARQNAPKNALRVEINRVHIRFTCYRGHAAKVGDGFLSAFKTIVKPFCGIISNENRRVLFAMLSDQYKGIVRNEASSLRRIAASMGRSDLTQAMILPMQGVYYSGLSKYNSRLDLEIEKHNLEVGTSRSKQQMENMAEGGDNTEEIERTVDETPRMEDLTRQGNLFAFREARSYKKRKQTPPFDTIAETTMKKYFEGVIPRETGKRHRNGQMELTKEWKKKRESIRGTLRNKFKN